MTIGNQLKKARQKKEVTINEVYKETRIHPNILSAMEEDSFDKILHSTYTRSFLKEYAAYLGLDADKIIAEYNKLYPKERTEQREPVSLEEKGPSPFEIDVIKIAKTVGIAAILVLAVLILILLFRGSAKFINKVSTQRAMRAKQAEVVKEAKKPRAKEAAEKTAQKETRPPKKESTPKAQVAAETRLAVPAGEKLKLTITATDDVWINLQVDGRVIFQNVLKAGSSEQWAADDSFKIWTGKAEALRLNLNGHDLGTPGSGLRRDIIITREGLKK